MNFKPSFCYNCGHRMWWDLFGNPATCTDCGTVSYLNPLPVVVMILHVAGGIVAIRRAIEPGMGMLALPSVYIDLGETWKEAAVRELQEETGVSVTQKDIRLLSVVDSVEKDTFLIFCLCNRDALEHLPPFIKNDEVEERVILKHEIELAFPSHTRALSDYFGALEVSMLWDGWK